MKATCIDTFDKLRAYKSGSRGFEKMERLGGLLYPGKDDMALMQADGFLITLALEMAAIVARDFPQLGPTIEMPSPGMSTTAEEQGAPPKITLVPKITQPHKVPPLPDVFFKEAERLKAEWIEDVEKDYLTKSQMRSDSCSWQWSIVAAWELLLWGRMLE